MTRLRSRDIRIARKPADWPVIVKSDAMKWGRQIPGVEVRDPIGMQVDPLQVAKTLEGPVFQSLDLVLGEVKFLEKGQPVKWPRPYDGEAVSPQGEGHEAGHVTAVERLRRDLQREGNEAGNLKKRSSEIVAQTGFPIWWILNSIFGSPQSSFLWWMGVNLTISRWSGCTSM